MPGPEFLRGERVSLRVLERDDLPFVQRAANDPDLRRATGGQSFSTTREYYERQFDDRDTDPKVIELLICDDDSPMGVVEFDPLDINRGAVRTS